MVEAAPSRVCIKRRAIDPRADGACRTVHVTDTMVLIERSVGGVRMRIGVPIAGYRDLVIRLRVPSDRATLVLRHADSELDVTIGNGAARDVAVSARAWSSLTGKTIAFEQSCVAIGAAFARRRSRTKLPRMSRRSRFARRRAIGDRTRLDASFAGEREIIART